MHHQNEEKCDLCDCNRDMAAGRRCAGERNWSPPEKNKQLFLEFTQNDAKKPKKIKKNTDWATVMSWRWKCRKIDRLVWDATNSNNHSIQKWWAEKHLSTPKTLNLEVDWLRQQKTTLGFTSVRYEQESEAQNHQTWTDVTRSADRKTSQMSGCFS